MNTRRLPPEHIPVFHSPAEVLQPVTRNYVDGYLQREHWHEAAQLIYASTGVMELTCEHGFWVISPQQALWMPARIPHQLKARGRVALKTVYLCSSILLEAFPYTPQSLVVSPLLREVVLRAEAVTSLSSPSSRAVHIMQVLLDEIRWAHAIPLRLSIPTDNRLQKICLALLQNPGDPRDLQRWGLWVGASSRTLSRLFQAQLGVSFALWRQHARILSSLPRLNQGEAIMRIAGDLGYDSAGAFSTAFRRFMGVTPRDFRARVG